MHRRTNIRVIKRKGLGAPICITKGGLNGSRFYQLVGCCRLCSHRPDRWVYLVPPQSVLPSLERRDWQVWREGQSEPDDLRLHYHCSVCSSCVCRIDGQPDGKYNRSFGCAGWFYALAWFRGTHKSRKQIVCRPWLQGLGY